MWNRLVSGLIQLLRRRPVILMFMFRSALEVTKAIDHFLTEGKIAEAKALIRKQANEKAGRLREILEDPAHRQHMSERTIRFYEHSIMELEHESRGAEIA